MLHAGAVNYPCISRAPVTSQRYYDRWFSQLSVPHRPAHGLRCCRRKCNDHRNRSEKQTIHCVNPPADGPTFWRSGGRKEIFETFHFGKKQAYNACDYTVEGDWSGAAFLLVAAAVAVKAEVQHLNTSSAQADKAITEALEKAGAHIMSGRIHHKHRKRRVERI